MPLPRASGKKKWSSNPANKHPPTVTKKIQKMRLGPETARARLIINSEASRMSLW